MASVAFEPESWLEDITNGPPDGRPLHLYRIEEEEFQRLQDELRELISVGRLKSASAPFVLWSSERYRRDYDGGTLSWAFLTEPLDCHLSQEDLRHMTREGLQRLGRPAGRTDSGNVQYLRTIAAEGGIPVRLLGGQGGYRSALVGLVADLGRMGLSCPRELARNLAAKRTARLPIGYRTEEFHDLFVDFAFEVVELRAIAPDGIASDRVEGWLDRERPDWREGLSLRIDGPAARSLLADAVSVTARSGLTSEPVRRLLRRTEEGLWKPCLEFVDRSIIAPEFLRGVDEGRSRLRLAAARELASVAPDLLLALEQEQAGGVWNCRRISAPRTARMECPLDRPAEVVVLADGRYLGRLELPGGAGIEPSSGLSIWLLSEMGEGGARELEYAGTASLKTADEAAWVLTPKTDSMDHTDGLQVVRESETQFGTLWRLSGAGRVFVADWNVRVETDAQSSEREEIVAVGPRDPRLLDRAGAPVFRGVPEILRRRADRPFRVLTSKTARFRVTGEQGWRNGLPQDPVLGRLAIAARDGEGIGARLSVSVVPESLQVSEVRLPEGARAIRFGGLPDGWSVRIGEGAPEPCGPDGSATCVLADDTRLKGVLPLVLASPTGAQVLAWSLVLPSKRADFVNMDDTLLASDAVITPHDLRQWRIIPAEGTSSALRIRLEGPEVVGAPRFVVPVLGEQPLSAFRHLIEEVLAVGGKEAELRLRALSGVDQSPRLVLRRFLGETQLEEGRLAAGASASERMAGVLDVLAVDMNDPGRMEVVASDRLHDLSEGRWFLLPRKNGRPLRPPRPLSIPEPSPTVLAEDGSYARTRDQRVGHFADLMKSDAAEAELAKLAKLVGVLMSHGASPASLDQVWALQLVPAAAVRLLFEGGAQLSDLLALEAHGGPQWILVSPYDWAEAIAKRVEALDRLFAGNPVLAAKRVELTRDSIAAAVRDITTLRPDLVGHIAIGLMQTGLADFMTLRHWLGAVPPSCIQTPDAALRDFAQHMARLHVERTDPLEDLHANAWPNGWPDFDTAVRGLVEAPLFAAEVAFKLRPRPTTRQKIQLLQAIQMDSGAFDTALPAAMAWQFGRLMT